MPKTETDSFKSSVPCWQTKNITDFFYECEMKLAIPNMSMGNGYNSSATVRSKPSCYSRAMQKYYFTT